MKAVVVERPGKMVIKEVETPKITPDEVLLKVQASSICNATDNHILHGIFEGYHDFYPQILGHEIAGEVVEVGSNVKGINLGELIVLYTPRGAFCEYVAVNPGKDICAKVPKEVPLKVRSLCEMFHGSYLASVYPAKIKEDETVLLVGQGPMGLTATACAKLTAKKVITVDMVEFRLQKSKEMGADVVYNRSKMTANEIVEAIMKETNNKGVDVAVMCIADDKSKELDAFDMAVKALRKNGRMTGLIVDVKEINKNHRLDPHLLLKKDIMFKHTLEDVYKDQAEMNSVFQGIVNKVVEGKIAFEKMVTHEVTFDELEYVLELCDKKLDEVIKVVVYPKTKSI